MEKKYSEYFETPNSLVRYRMVTYLDYDLGEVTDYSFEIFKRPYFFGTIGKKRWEKSIQTNSINMGFNFSQHLLK